MAKVKTKDKSHKTKVRIKTKDKSIKTKVKRIKPPCLPAGMHLGGKKTNVKKLRTGGLKDFKTKRLQDKSKDQDKRQKSQDKSKDQVKRQSTSDSISSVKESYGGRRKSQVEERSDEIPLRRG